MKKILRLVVLFVTSMAVPSAWAESLSGKILSIDSQNGIIGLSVGDRVEEVFVKEFIKNQGSKDLDGLDVGCSFSATVWKNPSGKFELVTVQKPVDGETAVLSDSDKDIKDEWLKVSEETAPSQQTDDDRGISREKHLKYS